MDSSAVIVRVVAAMLVVMAGACATPRSASSPGDPVANSLNGAGSAVVPASATTEQVLRGRLLTITHACGGCHGGGDNPAAEGYLAGARSAADDFLIGACATVPGAQPCFRTRPRNITPDNVTGLGRFSERQIFNALRYGLRPGETPDVEITSTVPGEGNFPVRPKYLAPPMPWPAWRHMSDQQLRDIAAYLKQGLKPVRNQVTDSEGPPDFWASAYSARSIGPYPAPAYPTERERVPADSAPGR